MRQPMFKEPVKSGPCLTPHMPWCKCRAASLLFPSIPCCAHMAGCTTLDDRCRFPGSPHAAVVQCMRACKGEAGQGPHLEALYRRIGAAHMVSVPASPAQRAGVPDQDLCMLGTVPTLAGGAHAHWMW